MGLEEAAREWRKAKKLGDRKGQAFWRSQIFRILGPYDAKAFLGEDD